MVSMHFIGICLSSQIIKEIAVQNAAQLLGGLAVFISGKLYNLSSVQEMDVSIKINNNYCFLMLVLELWSICRGGEVMGVS